MAIVEQLSASNETRDIVSGKYPLRNTVEWNSEVRAGQVTPSITLPAIPAEVSAECRYTFTAATANATFAAPSGVILGNDDGFSGLSAGNTLSYTDLTAGSIYECSFAVMDSTHITLLMKEWPTA